MILETINQASVSIKKDRSSSPYEKLKKEKARLEIISEKLSGM